MKQFFYLFCLSFLILYGCSSEAVVKMSDYGITPDTKENLSGKIQQALTTIKQEYEGKKITLLFESGRYDFHVEGAVQKEYYISNHDQPNPKPVGLALEDWKNLTVEEPTLSFMAVCFPYP